MNLELPAPWPIGPLTQAELVLGMIGQRLWKSSDSIRLSEIVRTVNLSGVVKLAEVAKIVEVAEVVEVV